MNVGNIIYQVVKTLPGWFGIFASRNGILNDAQIIRNAVQNEDISFLQMVNQYAEPPLDWTNWEYHNLLTQVIPTIPAGTFMDQHVKIATEELSKPINHEMLKFLLERNVDFGGLSNNYAVREAIKYAISASDYELLKLFAQHSNSLDWNDEILSRVTPIGLAYQLAKLPSSAKDVKEYDYASMIKFLLDKGGLVDDNALSELIKNNEIELLTYAVKERGQELIKATDFSLYGIVGQKINYLLDKQYYELLELFFEIGVSPDYYMNDMLERVDIRLGNIIYDYVCTNKEKLEYPTYQNFCKSMELHKIKPVVSVVYKNSDFIENILAKTYSKGLDPFAHAAKLLSLSEKDPILEQLLQLTPMLIARIY